jgi:hypothetical protein
MFNYDLFEIIVIAFVLSVIFIYSYIKSSGLYQPTFYNNKSLVNTGSATNIAYSTSVINSNNLQLVNTGVQTESTFNTQVDAGVQTESIVNTVQPIINSNIPVDAEVQTKSLCKLFLHNIKKFFCKNSSDITPQDIRLENMPNNLNPLQNLPTENVRLENMPNNLNPLQNITAENVINEASSKIQNSVPIEVSDIIYESNIYSSDTYNIMNSLQFAEAFNNISAEIKYQCLNGVHEYFIMINDYYILSVNPDLINCFF